MRGTRGRRRAAGLATVAGLLTLLVPLIAPAGADPGPAPPSKQRRILNDVHTDVLDVQYTGGQLRLQTRIGSPPYEFSPASDVLFQLKDIQEVSRFPVPDPPEWAFLGPAGAPVWVAPQTQDESVLFAGWDAESIPRGVLAGDAVDLRLVSVTGPGTVELFQVDGTGQPIRLFSSQDAAYRTVRQHVGSGAHAHANWGFTALGRYELTFEATGADLAGQPLNSGPVTYTWYVGGTQAGDVPALPSTTTLAVSPPSAVVGQEVTLTGAVAPAAAPGWLEFLDGASILGHAAVAGGQATLRTTALAAGTHQLTALFVPANTTDYQPSTSPPLTYQVSGTGPTTTTSSSSTTSTTTTTTTTTTTGTTTSTTSTTSPTSTSCVPVTTTQPASAAPVVLNNGHVDYAARIVGGALVSQIKDGTVAGTTTWRDPSRVVFHVVPTAATTIGGSGFGFLGNPGDRIWLIPQLQHPGILWLGWNTEEISAAQVSGGVSWSLNRVEGPGKLAIYLVGSLGQPQIVFNSGDGVPDHYQIPLNTHAHGNWAFTREGIYRVSFTHSATLASGAQVSDTEVVTFAVGAVDLNSALPADPPAQNNSGDGNCPAGINPSRLASTGATLAAPLTVGGLLVLAGLVVVIILRRRASSTVDGRR